MNFLESVFSKIHLWSLRKTLYILFLIFSGSLITGIAVFLLYMESLPSLSTWHTTILQNEFTTESSAKDFDTYIALEDRLFKELDSEILEKVLSTEKSRISRYTKNSFSDPKRWDKAWNRVLNYL